MRWRLGFLLGLGLVLGGQPFLAWGPSGHRIVGEIAWQNLTPQARKMTREWMPDNAYASLARTADWADGPGRSSMDLAWSLPLHYVNIPPNRSSYRRSRDCRSGACVVESVHRFRAELTASRAGDRTIDAVRALRFLSHFVGDLHQPLHVSHPDGKGGNKTYVLFFGEVKNLHWIWDTGWIERGIVALPEGYRDWEGYRRELSRNLDPTITAAARDLDPAAWADESLALAGHWTFEPVEELGPGDLKAFGSVIGRQLTLAGLRLAGLLNAIAALPDASAPESGSRSRSNSASNSESESASESESESESASKSESKSNSDSDAAEPSGRAVEDILRAEDASSWIGTTATVCGEIAGAVYRPDIRGRPTFLNFGDRHPRQLFTVVIWGDRRADFDRPEVRLTGKRVCVRGRIERHRRKPQIVLSRADQIWEDPKIGSR